MNTREYAYIGAGSLIAVVAVGYAVTSSGSASAPSPESIASPSLSQAPPQPTPQRKAPQAHPDDADALEVARVLRAYDGIIEAVTVADGKKAGCHDRTKGFGELLQCETEVRDVIVKSAAAKPVAEMATAPCARIVELGYRKYIERQSVFHEKFLQWLASSKGRLVGPMASRSLWEACGKSDALCNGKPYDFAFEAQYYENIGKIECTKSLFTCGRSDNECTINKVASRLGLGKDQKPSDGLFVRSTGTQIR